MPAIRIKFGLGITTMTIRKIVLFFFAILVAEIVALGFVLSLIISSQKDLATTENLRHRAFRVADELRQSSDDLTRMARTYVSTGDPAFERYFQKILAIRDGEKERPENYGRIYWDLIVAGIEVSGEQLPAISLDAQMKELNLTAEEQMELQAAKANSDALVSIETRAMNAVKGLFDEGGETVQRAPDLDLARSLMFSADYHVAKAAIMVPVDNFLASLEERMNTAVVDQRASLLQQQTLAAFVIALVFATFGILTIVIRRRVIAPVNLLVAQSEAIGEGDYGKQTELNSDDEIGILAGALNRMSLAIADDVAERERAEEELAKQRLNLRHVLENIGQGIVKWDADRRLVMSNRHYQDVLGVPDDLVEPGRSLQDVTLFIAERGDYGEGDPKELSEARMRFLYDGDAHQNELTIRDENIFNVFVQPTEDGGVVITYADITTRKHAEAALRESEERYALAMESAGEGLWDWDLDADTLTISPQFVKLMSLNFKATTIKPEQWTERMHPDDLAAYRRELKAHLTGEADSIQAEFRIRDPEGAYRLVEAQGKGHRNEQGRVFRIAGSVTDITERREAEKQIRQQRRNLRHVLENIAQGIVKWDAQRRLVIANRHFQKLLSLPDHLMNEGQQLQEVTRYVAERGDYGEGDPQELADGRIAFLFSGEVHRSELTIGGTSIYYVVVQPTDDGGVIITYTDITERKEAEVSLLAAKEQAETALTELKQTQARLVTTEKMASLGQLTAGIAHEIKNPLNFVNNFSETSVELLDELKEVVEPVQHHLGEEERDDVEDIFETLKGDLQKIHHHGSRADGIVKSMLLHARGDTSEHTQTAVNGLVEEALHLAYHGERARDKSFQVTLEEHFGDDAGEAELVPQDITRVVVNLLSNAFYAVKKRTESEKSAEYVPTVSVATSATGSDVEIRVRDNGTGMPKEVRDKLFEPFFTTKPTGEGTGLGLSMCFDIIAQQHGGEITVDSEPNAFTEFVLTLPRHTTNGHADT